MQGNDHVAAAQPDWIGQADTQLGALAATADEINCPTLIEALGMVEDAINALRKQQRLDRVDP